MLAKTCKICSTPVVLKNFDKCVPRKTDGTVITSQTIGDNQVIVFLPKGMVLVSVHPVWRFFRPPRSNYTQWIVAGNKQGWRGKNQRFVEGSLLPHKHQWINRKGFVDSIPTDAQELSDSPLHTAVKLGLKNILQELLKCPFLDINLQLEDKRTALHRMGTSIKQLMNYRRSDVCQSRNYCNADLLRGFH